MKNALGAVFDPNGFAGSEPIPGEVLGLPWIERISRSTCVSYSGKVPVSLFGNFHELCLRNPLEPSCKKKEVRRDRGIYYTPAGLVDYLTSKTLRKALNRCKVAEIEEIRVLDPSCGCGAFVIAGQGYSGELPAHISVDLLKKINKGEVDISRQDEDHIVSAYDAEIYSMDKAFGVFVEFLRKQKLYDRTIIIFTSDHGEEFGEHGRMGWHSHALYDEQLKVPLIIKLQNSRYASQIIDEQTRSIDILPTLLDILGISPLETFEGVSLINYLRGMQKEELIAVSQQDTPGELHPMAIRTKKWKLYDDQLFNLRSDPLEQKNLASKKKRVYRKMRTELDYILNGEQALAKSEDVRLDEQTLKRLKTLGYLD